LPRPQRLRTEPVAASRSYNAAIAPLFLSAVCANTATAEPLKNHYNDPFIRITNALRDCPEPRGPFMTEREAKADAHQRIERGTSCFNEGKCKEANAYFYDPRIAKNAEAAARAAIAKDKSLANSSVWFTVQRRFVFVQGCVANKAQIAKWDALVKALPEVDYVSTDLAVGTTPKNGRMPYPTMR
jgi:hypothetical protein